MSYLSPYTTRGVDAQLEQFKYVLIFYLSVVVTNIAIPFALN